jgi:hypothetical protein
MATPEPAAGAFAALHSAPLVPHLRGWWDAIFLSLVVLMDWFRAELPTIIQIVALFIGLLTAAQKLIELGWISNPRRKNKEKSDDAR